MDNSVVRGRGIINPTTMSHPHKAIWYPYFVANNYVGAADPYYIKLASEPTTSEPTTRSRQRHTGKMTKKTYLPWNLSVAGRLRRFLRGCALFWSLLGIWIPLCGTSIVSGPSFIPKVSISPASLRVYIWSLILAFLIGVLAILCPSTSFSNPHWCTARQH